MAEFAPLYSTRERILILAKILAVAVPVYLAGYFGLFPWLESYAPIANCDYIGEYTGMQLLAYGVLCGIPLSMALLVWLIEGSRSIRVWKLGQSPLPGEKVLRKTRYRHGAAARLRPAIVFAVVLLLVGAAVRGGFQANRLIVAVGPCENPSYSRSPKTDPASETSGTRQAKLVKSSAE